ncbi:MAG: DnaJ domain-containing protein, partial [Myxococcota bacterium]
MASTGDYYRVLNVGSGATSDDIKKAFRKLARTCHPDVSGDDPKAATKFAEIREAYETLVDPERRSRYDSRNERPTKKSHIRREWRPPGGWQGFSEHSKVRAARRTSQQKTDINLDDIFTQPGAATSDFGFGARPRQATNRHDESKSESADIPIDVQVPGRTARLGGTVTVRYPRMRRSSDGVNVYNYNEIYELRVTPRTCTGDMLRADRMGNFSTQTNRYGDLVCRVEVLPESGTHHPRRDSHVRTEPPKQGASKTHSVETATDSVRVSLVEAVLGGRVRIPTPKGAVNITIPPGTSSGKVLRLKGRSADGGDLMVRVEIDVPKSLDEESRGLIERFGELNPMD